MHSNKVVFAVVLGMMMSTAWAESAPATTSVITEEKVTVQANTASSSEPRVEVKVEDIDAPILE